MQAFWEVVASNSVLVVVLAAGVALLGRIWKNPWYLHLLWLFVLLKLVTPPIVTIPVALSAREVRPAPESHEVTDRPTLPSHPEAFGREGASITADREQRPLADDRAASEDPRPSVGDALPVSERRGVAWLDVLGWTWGIGILLFACGAAYRILRFQSLLETSVAPSPSVLNMAEEIAGRLDLKQTPEIRLLPMCVSPLVWSLGAGPRVFLPATLFDRLDRAAQEAILAHELAHVRRRDHWVRLLEAAITVLFWWHPVVWWAARQLQEFEDQCCDAMVVDLAPDAAKSYATALLDTLDFLCEGSTAAPLGATAAKSSFSLTRRIAMLKNRSWTARLTVGRFMLLVTAAAIPMAIAFGQKPPDATEKAQVAVARRVVNKLVRDFPEKADLSTPESAAAMYHRVIASPDPKSWLDLSAWAYSARDVVDIKRKMESHRDERAWTDEAYRNAEIIEVLTYREGLSQVTSKLDLKGPGREPYSARIFVKIGDVWKNFGEDRLASPEKAREHFNRIKDSLWASYLQVLDGVAKGKPVRLEADDLSSSRPKRSAPIAPGEPLGISVEKADLMGRVEWAMMHGGRDITARKTIEWGDVEKDADGNRRIRYKFYATIWDRDVHIVNRVFTFDAKGNILDMEDVEGFPQKKVEKPVNASTQEGMKELVEDFFTKNFRDVTARECLEWGEVTKDKDGNSSIRHRYRAKIWDKDTKIINQVFTFDPKGKFVSVKDVEELPEKH